MPIVVNYDDPSLVARLADSAGGYRAGMQTHQMAQNDLYRQQQMQMAQQRQAAAMQQQQLDNAYRQQVFDANQQQGTAQRQQQTDRAQAAIQANRQQQQATAAKQQAAQAQRDAAMDYVDQLEKSGSIDAATATRMRGDLSAGGNPFDAKPAKATTPKKEPTEADQQAQREKQLKDNQRILQQQRSELQNQQKKFDRNSTVGDEKRQWSALQTQIDGINSKLGLTNEALGKIVDQRMNALQEQATGQQQPTPQTGQENQDAAHVALHLTQAGVPPTVAADVAPIIAQAQASGGQINLKALATASGDKENFRKILAALGIRP